VRSFRSPKNVSAVRGVYPKRSRRTYPNGVSLPDKAPVTLTPYGNLSFSPINESSGLVKSRLWSNVFWTHNDSGDEPRIFPVKRDGSILKPEWAEEYAGIKIKDAVNIDWEDIATDK